MMSEAKKRGLGRGLSALLPSPSPAAMGHTGPASPAAASVAPLGPSEAPAPLAAPTRSRTYFAAGIEELYPSPEQPRRRFDDAKLGELADSMKAHGVIVPLVVRPRPDGGYYLIAGERRWRAAQRAGLHEVPVVVREASPTKAFEWAIVENVQRADLNPIEEAEAYQHLAELTGYTQEQ
ncbi:MAG: ParB/RepB/Spo0J family partition protein, partial [Kofleriaceae bacterium]